MLPSRPPPIKTPRFAQQDERCQAAMPLDSTCYELSILLYIYMYYIIYTGAGMVGTNEE